MFSISRFQNKVFYILILSVWIISSIYTMLNWGFVDGFIVFAFGSLFLGSIYLLQSLFIKMMKKEDKVLKKIRKKHRR